MNVFYLKNVITQVSSVCTKKADNDHLIIAYSIKQLKIKYLSF